jgi:hypothetical protein
MTPDEVRIKTYGSGNISYQPNEHPYFADCVTYNDCEVRWDLMQPFLKSKGTVLDIGWWCRKFSHLGWGSIGVDLSPVRIEIASDFMSPYDKPGRRPVYHQGDILDFTFSPVDAVLFIDAVMMFFGDDDRGWELFNNIAESSPLLFLAYQLRYGKSIPQHFAKQVIEQTEYTSYTLLEHPELRSYRFYAFER